MAVPVSPRYCCSAAVRYDRAVMSSRLLPRDDGDGDCRERWKYEWGGRRRVKEEDEEDEEAVDEPPPSFGGGGGGAAMIRFFLGRVRGLHVEVEVVFDDE